MVVLDSLSSGGRILLTRGGKKVVLAIIILTTGGEGSAKDKQACSGVMISQSAPSAISNELLPSDPNQTVRTRTDPDLVNHTSDPETNGRDQRYSVSPQLR